MKVSEFYQQHLCGFCCLLCVTLEHLAILSLDLASEFSVNFWNSFCEFSVKLGILQKHPVKSRIFLCELGWSLLTDVSEACTYLFSIVAKVKPQQAPPVVRRHLKFLKWIVPEDCLCDGGAATRSVTAIFNDAVAVGRQRESILIVQRKTAVVMAMPRRLWKTIHSVCPIPQLNCIGNGNTSILCRSTSKIQVTGQGKHVR